MAMSLEEITEGVTEVLVDALGVDEEDVASDATLTGDLGAESIDFLDIVFRLENKFDIKIPRGELFPDNLLSNPDYVDGGKVTPAGLVVLKQALPHTDFTEFEKDPDVNQMPELFTVHSIVKYVESKVNG